MQLPGDWKRTLEESRVDTGDYGKPLAVGPGGEIIARRDDDILLIKPDKSVSTVYSFPQSANQYAKVAELDERWIVLGVGEQTPANYQLGAFNPTRTVFRTLEPLPAALSALTGINEDQTSLVGDGNVYAWITGLAAGGTGIARWSPQTGLTHISTVRLFDLAQAPQPQPRVHIAGPYVVLSNEDSIVTTLVDTRSGALAQFGYPVIGAANATIGIQFGHFGESSAPTTGSVRTDSLPPLSCSSSDSIRASCEISLPGKGG